MTLTERKTNPEITAMFAETLTQPEMEKVIGGGNDVLDVPCNHDWHYTGNEREGWFFFFWTKHEKEQKCSKCNATTWVWED